MNLINIRIEKLYIYLYIYVKVLIQITTAYFIFGFFGPPSKTPIS